MERTTPASWQAAMIASQLAEGDFQRLLDNDVFARPRGGYGRFRMGAAGRADGDNLYPWIGQHVVQRVIRRAAGLGGQRVGGRGHLVEAGDQLGPADVADRLGVEAADHPAANNAETEHDGKS